MNWVLLAMVLLVVLVATEATDLVLHFILNKRLRKANSELLERTEKLNVSFQTTKAMFVRSTQVIAELNKRASDDNKNVTALQERVEQLEASCKAFDVPIPPLTDYDDDDSSVCEKCKLIDEDEDACQSCTIVDSGEGDDDIPLPSHSSER